MTLEEYYKKLYKLSFINRYSSIFRINNENVAQHSFFVAAIVLKLYEEYVFELNEALLAAICHDIPEVDIGDIIHSVKKDNPELDLALKSVEKKAISKYPYIIQYGHSIYNGNTVEGKVAQLADVFQVHQYVNNEISLGNTNMERIHRETKQRIEVLRKELKPHERS